MSKNIVIQEGGIGKQLTVDKLKTNLVGGGTCLWVPEDGTRLTTKHISENGTCKASDEGYYGYSEVTVSGIGTATGTGPDGEDHSYSEDGEGGVTDTVLPASISVITPPTVTTYPDGATIDFSGMVVKAYLRSGNVWSDSAHPDGVIPISELTLPVTTASKSEVSGASATSSLIDFPVPITGANYSSIRQVASGTILSLFSGSGATITAWIRENQRNTVEMLGASASAGSGSVTESPQWIEYHGSDPTPPQLFPSTISFPLTDTYTYNGKTVHYGGYIASYLAEVSGLGYDEIPKTGPVAWTMIYGTISGGTQTIPVQWTRGDGKTLESSFDITVT